MEPKYVCMQCGNSNIECNITISYNPNHDIIEFIQNLSSKKVLNNMKCNACGNENTIAKTVLMKNLKPGDIFLFHNAVMKGKFAVTENNTFNGILHNRKLDSKKSFPYVYTLDSYAYLELNDFI